MFNQLEKAFKDRYLGKWKVKLRHGRRACCCKLKGKKEGKEWKEFFLLRVKLKSGIIDLERNILNASFSVWYRDG